MDKLVVRGTEINVQWNLKRDDFLSLTAVSYTHLDVYKRQESY